MTIGDIKNLQLPDDVEIKINSIWDENKQELTPSYCFKFYHKEDNKVYLTPQLQYN